MSLRKGSICGGGLGVARVEGRKRIIQRGQCMLRAPGNQRVAPKARRQQNGQYRKAGVKILHLTSSLRTR